MSYLMTLCFEVWGGKVEIATCIMCITASDARFIITSVGNISLTKTQLHILFCRETSTCHFCHVLPLCRRTGMVNDRCRIRFRTALLSCASALYWCQSPSAGGLHSRQIVTVICLNSLRAGRPALADVVPDAAFQAEWLT